jgi:hypothetical protein
MHHNLQKLLYLGLSAGAFALLAACGGSDDAPTVAAQPANCKELTYTQNTAAVSGNPYTNGQKVCFAATTTTLDFSGKSLTNPTQNTAVAAPNAAYTFVDGAGATGLCYEVAFSSGTLREINVGKGCTPNNPATFNFQGQFN